MPSFQSLRGFRDFLPGEMQARTEVFDRIESVVESYGFREIDTPSLEPLDLFLVKSGEELVEQTYSFTDRGDRDVTLVPEQTPTRARLLAQRKDLTMPVKWFSTSKRWRYEAPQKGRLREFYQTDIDIFGADSVQADAEILAVAADIMDALDVLDAVDIRINDRRLLEGVLDAYGIDDPEAVMEVIDDREKMDRAEFRAELQDVGLAADDATAVDDLTDISGPIADVMDDIADIAPDDPAARDAVDRIRDLHDALAAYGIADTVIIDLSIVRGLAYYTGLVFEVFDTQGDLRAVCGGGRYDDLVDLFGGEPTPAVGFAIGDAVIEELMRREGVWPSEDITTDVYVLPVSAEVRDEALDIASALRANGCTVETDLRGRNVSGQFDYADTIGADTVVVVGTRDLEQGAVTVKDMDTGDEEQVDRDAVVDRLSR